uniref:Phosphatidylinositol glycan anchor biosynthesis class G n=1 Tax=Sphaeramia orbicularis TaxID=375764 RepID=A0A672ZVW2_9TELE
MKVRSSVLASFILIFEVIGVALFLRGFFPVPVKSSLSSKSKLSDLPAEPVTGRAPNGSRLPQPLFKRVVIMLVDALREDFVFGPSGRIFMPYTRHVVERGSSHSFVAKARPPTVTMPRIKVRGAPVQRWPPSFDQRQPGTIFQQGHKFSLTVSQCEAATTYIYLTTNRKSV